MQTDLDYLGHLASESARFADAIRLAPPAARVPSCPDWTADDLLWHLAEVQFFWGTIVREGLPGDEAGKLKPDRPAGRDGLLAFYQRASSDLGDALASASPGSYAWTWSDDKTVGFIRRRQAQEALIHRLDAELAAGDRTPMDALLAADGVDEVLRVMYGAVPGWGAFTPASGQTVRFLATDTGDSWLVTLGRFTGTDPDDGTSYDDPEMQAAETGTGATAAAEISASAADLDCWLWGRPPLGPVQRSGDPGVLSGVDAVLAQGLN
jgi:uncharacterized protein (TIGR03083 family)